MEKTTLQKLSCKRCQYQWYPRKDDVRFCPKCKTSYWDMDRQKEMPVEKMAKNWAERKYAETIANHNEGR